jgi:DNA polymerase III epsilon subunit-like protein
MPGKTSQRFDSFINKIVECIEKVVEGAEHNVSEQLSRIEELAGAVNQRLTLIERSVLGSARSSAQSNNHQTRTTSKTSSLTASEKMPSYIFAFDVETTGLPIFARGSRRFYPPHDTDKYNTSRVASIGWALFSAEDKACPSAAPAGTHAANAPQQTRKITCIGHGVRLIKPDGWTMSAAAGRVNGLTTESLTVGGVSFTQALNEFAEDLEEAEFILGYNVEFDVNVLASEAIRAGHAAIADQLQNRERIDAMVYTRTGRRLRLGTAFAQRFPGAHFHAHTALGDTFAAASLHFGVHLEPPPTTGSHRAETKDEEQEVPLKNQSLSLADTFQRGFHAARNGEVKCTVGAAGMADMEDGDADETEEIRVVRDLCWTWYTNVLVSPHTITGKYLFFAKSREDLEKIALELLTLRSNDKGKRLLDANQLGPTAGNAVPFYKAKISNTVSSTLLKAGDYVLCLYYHDNSLKRKIAQQYGDRAGIAYRYWKSNAETRNGTYSQQFLDRIA